jgi:uncharacterized protein (TIGR02284 family)
MGHKNEVLDMLVDVSRYGARFYEQAAAKVEDRTLKALFARMAQAKQAVAVNFSSQADDGRERLAPAGSLLGEFQRRYAEIRSRLSSGGYGYLDQLLHIEQELVKALAKAAFEPATPLSIQTAAALCLPRLQGCVEELGERKQQLRIAA